MYMGFGNHLVIREDHFIAYFEYIKDLSQFIKDNIKNVTRVDFLPYHKMGLEKYEKLGIESPYRDKDAMDKIKCDELHKEFMKDFNVN